MLYSTSHHISLQWFVEKTTWTNYLFKYYNMYSIGQYDPKKWLISCYNLQNWIRTIELSCNLRYCDTYRRFKCVYLWYCRWKAIQHNWGVLLNLLPSKQYTDKRHVLPIDIGYTSSVPGPRLCTPDITLWFHAGSHYSHLHGKKQLHSVVTYEKIIKINRFISFMIILPIIIFNNKHNGYYPLFDFYLNSLFTVNYN